MGYIHYIFRDIVMDTMGLLMAVFMGAIYMIAKVFPLFFSELNFRFYRLVKIIADGEYRG